MPDQHPPNPSELVATDLEDFLQTAAQQAWPLPEAKLDGPKSFQLAFGTQPIQLGNIEFRILLFLASRPYHAFKRRAIAEAVSSDWQAVTETDVDEHIASLRDQLGVLHDYVQSVPYIGYRFKA